MVRFGCLCCAGAVQRRYLCGLLTLCGLIEESLPSVCSKAVGLLGYSKPTMTGNCQRGGNDACEAQSGSTSYRVLHVNLELLQMPLAVGGGIKAVHGLHQKNLAGTYAA